LSVCFSACPLNYSESYERIFVNFWTGGAWRKDQSIRFLWAIRITIVIRAFLKNSLFTIATISIDSQELNITIIGGGLNSVSAFSLYSNMVV